MSFDPECYELAAAFMEDHPERDTPENRQKLAQTIQDAIEEWFTEGE